MATCQTGYSHGEHLTVHKISQAYPGAPEIQQAIDSGTLPSHITESLHGLREIGNFAAHPTKDQHSGEIIDVETGEAEWTLDTLEALFDFYFVAPAKTAKRKIAFNKKLRAADRKEI